jgi:hypothetical protein
MSIDVAVIPNLVANLRIASYNSSASFEIKMKILLPFVCLLNHVCNFRLSLAPETQLWFQKHVWSAADFQDSYCSKMQVHRTVSFCPCVTSRAIVFTRFNTVVPTFGDWFRRIQMTPRRGRFCPPPPPRYYTDLSQLSYSVQNLIILYFRVFCIFIGVVSEILLTKEEFHTKNVFRYS